MSGQVTVDEDDLHDTLCRSMEQGVDQAFEAARKIARREMILWRNRAGIAAIASLSALAVALAVQSPVAAIVVSAIAAAAVGGLLGCSASAWMAERKIRSEHDRAIEEGVYVDLELADPDPENPPPDAPIGHSAGCAAGGDGVDLRFLDEDHFPKDEVDGEQDPFWFSDQHPTIH